MRIRELAVGVFSISLCAFVVLRLRCAPEAAPAQVVTLVEPPPIVVASPPPPPVVVDRASEVELGESPEHLQALAIACNAWAACIHEHLDGEVVAMVPTVDVAEAEALRAARVAAGSSELGPLAARACVIGDALIGGRCPMPRAARAR